MSRSAVNLFKSNCGDTQTHSHSGPIALPGPLKWSIKQKNRHEDDQRNNKEIFQSVAYSEFKKGLPPSEIRISFGPS